jgi:putative ABC transport system permease protein
MRIAADLRHAARRLWQSPGYTATVLVTFALALGANSAIFSAVNTALLRPMPVRAPDDLAVAWQTDEGGQAVVELTYRHLREWTAAGNAFTSAAVMGSHNWSAVLEQHGEPSRLWFNGVSAAFFDTLGVQPVLGRGLRAEDDVPNAAPVAVLNHGAWIRRFGGDPSIVGRTMTLDGQPVEIVGVMPEGLDFPRGAEFWIPVVPMLSGGQQQGPSILDTVGVFYVIGRMRPDLDAQRLQAALDDIERNLDRADAGRLKWGARAVAVPFLDHVFGRVRPALRVLWAAVCVLLFIACANVSGLMLTRVSRRQHEDAIRFALGASRASLGRLWIMEILILAAAGGAAGLALAQWIAAAIVALAPDDLPRIGELAIDSTVVLFTLAAVLATALITGSVPLRHIGTSDLLPALEGERTTSTRRTIRTRSTLLIAQIALSIVLLVAAGLVLRSFVALRQIDLGFTPERVLSLEVQPRGIPGSANEWLDAYLTRVRALPGVEAAGAVYLRPLMLGPIGQGITVLLEGQPDTREAIEANPVLNYQMASSGYFETLGIPLRAGRFFTRQDSRGQPRVAIVSESAARRLWPGQDPVGRRLSMSTFTPGERSKAWRTVVGVVADVRYRGLDEVQLDVYDPALQMVNAADNVVIRTSGDPLALAGNVRAIARQMDPQAIVAGVTTLDAVVGRAEAPWRLTMWMFVLFAAFAFGLAALGLFGLVALDVSHRRREFAIRIALGAPRGAVLREVLVRAAWRVAAGLALGFGGALAASRLVKSVLFGIGPGDLVTYGIVLIVVVIAVSVAAYLPARTASRTQPQALLRI